MTDREELDLIAHAIRTNRFLDPPDGGDVPLAEQVARMYAALEIAEDKLRAIGRWCTQYDKDAETSDLNRIVVNAIKGILYD